MEVVRMLALLKGHAMELFTRATGQAHQSLLCPLARTTYGFVISEGLVCHGRESVTGWNHSHCGNQAAEERETAWWTSLSPQASRLCGNAAHTTQGAAFPSRNALMNTCRRVSVSQADNGD